MSEEGSCESLGRLDMPTNDAAPSLAHLVHSSDKTGVGRFPPCAQFLASTSRMISPSEPPWSLAPLAADAELVCSQFQQGARKKRLVWFGLVCLERDTFRNKNMEIVEDFEEKKVTTTTVNPGNRQGFCV